MIISCIKCNKKFEVSDELIPDKGRLLQCGSCSNEWFFDPKIKFELIKEDNLNNTPLATISNKVNNQTKPELESEDLTIINPEIQNFIEIKKENKEISFLSIILLSIITSVALLIIVDTFKFQLSFYFPKLGFYINSLYEIIKDILLFIKDLT